MGQLCVRGIRDGISRGREWIAVIADIAVIARDRKSKTLFPQVALVELPGAAWHRTKCRGPSTQPYFPFGFAQGRSLSVGMTGDGVIKKKPHLLTTILGHNLRG